MSARKLSRTEEIADWIEAQIRSGSIRPDMRVDETQVSEKFQVSKTPVREALIHLASKGLIVLRQRKGAVVASLRADEIVAVFDVLTELECMAARLAASRMSTAMRQQLAAVLDQSALKTDDDSAYSVLNTMFHELIYKGACNPYLETSIKDARTRLSVYRRFPFQKPGQIHRSFADHDRIARAIVQGDAAAADGAMRTHLTAGGRIFADLVAMSESAEVGASKL